MNNSIMMDKVSVIIPAYNSGRYIIDAIESALKQTVQVEVIVIDDNSQDNTREIIADYIHSGKIKYVKNPKNMGVADSRNYGVSISSGTYIAFLDADDWWRTDKLEIQLRFMKEHNYQLCATARELCTEQGERTGTIIHIEDTVNREQLLRHNSIACSSVVGKREIIQKVPMSHSEVHEDYLTWLKMIDIVGSVGGIDQPLLYYRVTQGGKSRNRLKSAKMTYGVYRIYGISPIKSLYYLASHMLHGLKKYYGSK